MRIEDHAEVTRRVQHYNELVSLRKEIDDHGLQCTLSIPGKLPLRMNYELDAAAKKAALAELDVCIESVTERLNNLGVEV